MDPSWRLGYRPTLDGLRGIAILLVMAAHAAYLKNAGAVGVLVFFVLSGFLITSLLLSEHDEAGRVDLIAFYLRRSARLLPGLLAMSALVAVYLIATGKVENLLPDVGGALSYVGNWLQIGGMKMTWTAHTWSLAVEEQFYVIWPALILLVIRFPRPALIVVGLLVASLVWRFVLGDVLGARAPRTSRGLDAVAPALLAGAALACVVRARPTLSSGRLGAVVGSALIAWVVADLALGGTGTWVLELTTLGTILIIAAVHSSQTGPLTVRPLRYVGRISYGLYLYHFPIFSMLVLSRPFEFAVTFAVAIASYHLLEAPILRRVGRSKRAQRVRAPREASTSPVPASGG